MTKVAAPHGDVSFSVTNCGTIGRADFKLRPLTLLYGPAHTGKSLLAKLVCSMHRSLGKLALSARLPARGGSRSRRRTAWERLSDEERHAFSEWGEGLRRNTRLETVPPCPVAALRALRRTIQGSIPDDIGLEVGEALKRCFGIGSLRDFARGARADPPRIDIGLPWASGGAQVGIELGTATTVRTTLPPAAKMVADPWVRDVLSRAIKVRGKDAPGAAAEEERYLRAASALASGMFRPLACGTHYLPADKGMLLRASRLPAVARAASDSVAASFGLPGVYPDLISVFSRAGEGRGAYGTFAAEIETGILGGFIREEPVAGSDIPERFFFPVRKRTRQRISLEAVSSTVAELAPLILLLRHEIRKGDLLVLEKPEVHVYPGLQVKLAVRLARLVRAGLRVFVITDSHWILEQFANLAGMSKMSNAARKRMESDRPDLAGASLGTEQIGVWFATPGKGAAGSVMREIEFDEEGVDYDLAFPGVGEQISDEWGMIVDLVRGEKGH